jgi:hypothetical protein
MRRRNKRAANLATSLTLIANRTIAYSRSARNTMKMDTTRYVSMALSLEEALVGAIDRTLLKMLTKTRKRVTSRAIRPGTTRGRMRNETHETHTNSMHGR